MGGERGRDDCWNGNLGILICKCRNLDTSAQEKQEGSRPKISYIHMPPGFQNPKGSRFHTCLFPSPFSHQHHPLKKKKFHFSPSRQDR